MWFKCLLRERKFPVDKDVLMLHIMTQSFFFFSDDETDLAGGISSASGSIRGVGGGTADGRCDVRCGCDVRSDDLEVGWRDSDMRSCSAFRASSSSSSCNC